jgi:hypothetical protein
MMTAEIIEKAGMPGNQNLCSDLAGLAAATRASR